MYTQPLNPPKRRQPRPLTEADLLRQQIKALENEIEFVKAETNRFIDDLERRANARVIELAQRQVDHDNKVIEAINQSMEILLAENEELKAENRRLKNELARKPAQKKKSKWRLQDE